MAIRSRCPDLYLNTGVNDLQVVATLADGSRVAMDNWDMGVREVTVTASGRYVGAHLDPANDYASRIQAWTDQTGGLGPDMTMYFESWEGYQTFGAYPYLPEQIAGAGSLTMVTWESFGSTLEDIYTGQQDAYITEWARRVADYGETVIVRFDHEFNNHEYPWTGQQNGNNPAAYVAAFRHVATLVEQAGADNARFMWSPNYRASGETEAPSDDMENYYPGDGYVDFIGVSGYNWGDDPVNGTGWTAAATIYDSFMSQISRIAPDKPVIFAEIGTAPDYDGNSAAQWIRDAFATFAGYDQLKGVVWFNDRAYDTADGMDFRVVTDNAALGTVPADRTQAFAEAAGAWRAGRAIL